MALEEATCLFSRATVCMVQNWEETKVRGAFTHVVDPDPLFAFSRVQSRMYYNVSVQFD